MSVTNSSVLLVIPSLSLSVVLLLHLTTPLPSLLVARPVLVDNISVLAAIFTVVPFLFVVNLGHRLCYSGLVCSDQIFPQSISISAT